LLETPFNKTSFLFKTIRGSPDAYTQRCRKKLHKAVVILTIHGIFIPIEIYDTMANIKITMLELRKKLQYFNLNLDQRSISTKCI